LRSNSGVKRSKHGPSLNAVYRYAIIKISTGVKIELLTTNIKSNRIHAQRPKKQKNVKISTKATQPSKVKQLSPLNPTSAAMPPLMWPDSPKQKNVNTKTTTSQPSKVNKTPTAKSALSNKSTKPKPMPSTTPTSTPTPNTKPTVLTTVGGKPVGYLPSKSVLTASPAFAHKELTDRPILNLGDACPFSCTYCYQRHMAFKRVFADGSFVNHPPALQATLIATGMDHQAVVLKRCGRSPGETGLKLLEQNLKDWQPAEKSRKIVCFTSNAVDPAGNMADVEETALALNQIFEATNWDVRILSKSDLLPKLAELVKEEFRHRMIFGVSTGTLDDDLATAIEIGAPLVSERIRSLHWLQDKGYRTFGMICPSLPQANAKAYASFSKDICKAIRLGQCEHVWAEPLNVRGNSTQNTINALMGAGFTAEADALSAVTGPGTKPVWEAYAQATFLAHTKNIPASKLRFLHYPPIPTATSRFAITTRAWWLSQVVNGAIVLN